MVEEDAAENKMTTPCGVPQIKPPEMSDNKEHDRRVDSWNLGVLLYMLLTRSMMFKNYPGSSRFNKEDWEIDLDDAFNQPGALSIKAFSLVSKLVRWNAEDRIFPEQICEDSYLTTDVSANRSISELIAAQEMEHTLVNDNRKLCFKTTDHSIFDQYYTQLE